MVKLVEVAGVESVAPSNPKVVGTSGFSIGFRH